MCRNIEPSLTHFEYCYRDASNFKAHGAIAVDGSLFTNEREAILMRLESKEFFIAEQVGLPALYENLYRFSSGATSDDHCWHEFVAFHDMSADENDLEIWGAASTLIQNFSSVAEWNCRLSPHGR